MASDIGKYFHRRLTAEEEDKLFELYATLGPQWMEIGRRMGKYAATVRAAVRNNKMKEKCEELCLGTLHQKHSGR